MLDLDISRIDFIYVLVVPQRSQVLEYIRTQADGELELHRKTTAEGTIDGTQNHRSIAVAR